MVERLTAAGFGHLIDQDPHGQVYAITGVKGGSGRSSIALCLAVALAETGTPVLALDLGGPSPDLVTALDRRKQLKKAKNLPITTKTVTDFSELGVLARSFRMDEGHVILDLPPTRSVLHQVGLLISDVMIFATRSDNQMFMWTERTRDMVAMARNLEVPEDLADRRKPCRGVMIGYRGTPREKRFLAELQEDEMLSWKGTLKNSEYASRWLASGRAPWECSSAGFAQEWRRVIGSMI